MEKEKVTSEEKTAVVEEEKKTRIKYYKMCLRIRRDNKDCSLQELPKIIGSSENENSCKPFPILGIKRDEEEVEEFFTGKIVKPAPWKGLMYAMLIPISAKEMAEIVRKLTIEEQFRIVERMEVLESNIIRDRANTR